jgi:tRNA threonylcarbamoyladenosine biosynthesis protein TsaE
MTLLSLGEADTQSLAANLVPRLGVGDTVLLIGELGAGKTTLVRAMLTEWGWTGPVRSPTFNLLHVYATTPPVVHADLYRLREGGAESTGLEEYLDSHVVLVEWPDRAAHLFDPVQVWRIRLEFAPEQGPDARRIIVTPPRAKLGT